MFIDHSSLARSPTTSVYFFNRNKVFPRLFIRSSSNERSYAVFFLVDCEMNLFLLFPLYSPVVSLLFRLFCVIRGALGVREVEHRLSSSQWYDLVSSSDEKKKSSIFDIYHHVLIELRRVSNESRGRDTGRVLQRVIVNWKNNRFAR